MSKSHISPTELDFAPCPPGLPDAMYATPDYNPQPAKNEINRIFSLTKPVSSNSTGTPSSSFGGIIEIAVDSDLPISLEMVNDSHTATSWVPSGSTDAADFIAPKGRKAGYIVNGGVGSFHWRANLGYNIFQLTSSGDKVLIGKAFVYAGGSDHGQNHAGIYVGNASSAFTVDSQMRILNLSPASFSGGVLGGQANNPGNIVLPTVGKTVHFYLMQSPHSQAVAKLALSSMAI